MKRYSLLISFVLFIVTNGFAQIEPHEENIVKDVINKLITGLKNADSTLARSAFADDCVIQTISKTKEGEYSLKTTSLDDFIKFIGTPHEEKFEEQIVFSKIIMDGNLASVWTDYKFYINEKISHCGVNSFQLFKDKTGWKIIYVANTRRKDNCSP